MELGNAQLRMVEYAWQGGRKVRVRNILMVLLHHCIMEYVMCL